MSTSRLTRFAAEIRRRQLPGVLVLYGIGAWAALQAADLLFPGWRIPDEAIRFVWTGAVLLLPVVVVFGWIYDVSPRGIGRTGPAGDEVLPLGRRDAVILFVMVSIAAAVAALMVQQTLDLREPAEPAPVAAAAPPNSIAVLPFVNMSGSQENEYFSDGITEQLLNELARVPGLQVAARTSSFSFKGRNEPMQRVGADLGVRNVLEGSVRRADNRVRITVQLIDVQSGFHLWSEVFDREVEDIFAVQDEIARAIVRTLSVELKARDSARLDRIPTGDVEAFDLYLRAIAVRETYSAEAVVRANELLEEAIRLDPRFALAIDALAYGYILETFYGTRTVDEAAELAAPLLATAIELEPDLEEAYASLGLLNNRLRRFDDANENFETALRINPNYFGGLVNHGLNLTHQGRLKEAAAHYFRAQAQDPLNGNLNFNLGALLMLMGEFEEGHRFILKSVDLDSSNRMARGAVTHWRGQYGRLVDAVLYGRAVAEEMPEFTANLGALAKVYVRLGMFDVAREVVERIEAVAPDSHDAREAEEAIWWAEGQLDRFIERATAEFRTLDAPAGAALGMSDRDTVFRYGLALLYESRFEEAASHLFWAAGGNDGIAATTYDDMYRIKPLALAYRRSGRDTDAALLLEQSLELARRANENGWSTPQWHVRVAEIYAVQGEYEKAVTELERAVEKGFREIGELEYGLYWLGLQDDEAFNAVKVRILRDIDTQRERLRLALTS